MAAMAAVLMAAAAEVTEKEVKGVEAAAAAEAGGVAALPLAARLRSWRYVPTRPMHFLHPPMPTMMMLAAEFAVRQHSSKPPQSPAAVDHDTGMGVMLSIPQR